MRRNLSFFVSAAEYIHCNYCCQWRNIRLKIIMENKRPSNNNFPLNKHNRCVLSRNQLIKGMKTIYLSWIFLHDRSRRSWHFHKVKDLRAQSLCVVLSYVHPSCINVLLKRNIHCRIISRYKYKLGTVQRSKGDWGNARMAFISGKDLKMGTAICGLGKLNYVDGLIQKRCNSIANALEFGLFCIRWWMYELVMSVSHEKLVSYWWE